MAKTQNNLPPTNSKQIISQSLKVTRASILPPPEELSQYEIFCPGVTKTLIEEFKAQAEHRRNLEKMVIESNTKAFPRGQIFAFIISILTIIFGFILILKDKNALGIASILSSLAALLGVFFYGTNSNKKERIEKAKLNP